MIDKNTTSPMSLDTYLHYNDTYKLTSCNLYYNIPIPMLTKLNWSLYTYILLLITYVVTLRWDVHCRRSRIQFSLEFPYFEFLVEILLNVTLLLTNNMIDTFFIIDRQITNKDTRTQQLHWHHTTIITTTKNWAGTTNPILII